MSLAQEECLAWSCTAQSVYKSDGTVVCHLQTSTSRVQKLKRDDGLKSGKPLWTRRGSGANNSQIAGWIQAVREVKKWRKPLSLPLYLSIFSVSLLKASAAVPRGQSESWQ